MWNACANMGYMCQLAVFVHMYGLVILNLKGD